MNCKKKITDDNDVVLKWLAGEATADERLSILALIASRGESAEDYTPTASKGSLKRAIKILRSMQSDFPPERRYRVDEAVVFIRNKWMPS